MTGKGARTRRRIVQCAATILAERGVTGTNLSDVVQAAAVTKGALYFHFASKDELILGVELEYHADSHSMLSEIETDPDPMRRLVKVTFALLRRQLSNSLAQAHSRLMLARVAPPLQSLLPVPPVDWPAVILEWLTLASEQAILPTGLDLDEVAETIDDCLVGAVTGHQVEHREVPPIRRIALLWRMFLLPALVPDVAHRAALERLIEEESLRPPDTSDPDELPGFADNGRPPRSLLEPAG